MSNFMPKLEKSLFRYNDSYIYRVKDKSGSYYNLSPLEIKMNCISNVGIIALQVEAMSDLTPDKLVYVPTNTFLSMPRDTALKTLNIAPSSYNNYKYKARLIATVHSISENIEENAHIDREVEITKAMYYLMYLDKEDNSAMGLVDINYIPRRE